MDHFCAYCFQSLLNHFNQEVDPIKINFKSEEYPLFVTWKILAKEEYVLRGCIGNFSPMELESGLREYALNSALYDSRFDPISINEIHKLQVGISLLTEFQVCTANDWEIGVHGIWIDFSNERGQKFSSTFLPEVALEWNWDRQETLQHLVRKAGSSIQQVRDLKVTRYKSLKGSMTYQQYLEYSGR